MPPRRQPLPLQEEKVKEAQNSPILKELREISSRYQSKIIEMNKEQLEKNGLIDSTALFNITDIPSSIKEILTELTGLKENLNEIYKDLRQFYRTIDRSGDMRNNAMDISFKQMQSSNELWKNMDKISENPLWFLASQAATTYPGDEVQQMQYMIRIILGSEEKLKEDSLVEQMNPEKKQELKKEFKEIKEAVNLAGNINKMDVLKRILKRSLVWAFNLHVYLLSKLGWVIKESVGPSVSVAAIVGFVSNFSTAAQAGLITHYLTGDRGFGFQSTNQILNVGGAITMVGGFISYFGPGSNIGGWVANSFDYVVGREKSAWDLLSVFSQFWGVVYALTKDIINIFPNYEDMFAVRLVRDPKKALNFITPTRTVLEIIKDVSVFNRTKIERVNIVYFAWLNGLTAYNLTQALNETSSQWISENTITEVVSDFAADAAISVVSNVLDNKKVKEAITKAAVHAIEEAKQSLPELAQELKDNLPEIATNVVESLSNSDKFRDAIKANAQGLSDAAVETLAVSVSNQFAGANLQKSVDTVVNVLGNSIADQVFETVASENAQAQLMLASGGRPLTNQQKIAAALQSATGLALEHLISNPEVAMNAAQAVVSVAGPIVEAGVTTAVSQGLGKAQAEGVINNMALGAIQASFGLDAKYANTPARFAGYVAGRGVAEVVEKSKEAVQQVVDNPLLVGASFLPPVAGLGVAGLQAAGVLKFGGKKKKSVRKSVRKTKPKTSVRKSKTKSMRKSVRKSKTKKSVRKSIRKSIRKSVRKTKPKKSVRKSVRKTKPKKSVRKSMRKSIRKTKPKKSIRKSMRKSIRKTKPKKSIRKSMRKSVRKSLKKTKKSVRKSLRKSVRKPRK